MSHEVLNRMLSTRGRVLRFEIHSGYVDVYRAHGGSPQQTIRTEGGIVIVGGWVCVLINDKIQVFSMDTVREVGGIGNAVPELDHLNLPASALEIHLHNAIIKREAEGGTFDELTGIVRIVEDWVFFQMPGSPQVRVFPRSIIYSLTEV